MAQSRTYIFFLTCCTIALGNLASRSTSPNIQWLKRTIPDRWIMTSSGWRLRSSDTAFSNSTKVENTTLNELVPGGLESNGTNDKDINDDDDEDDDEDEDEDDYSTDSEAKPDERKSTQLKKTQMNLAYEHPVQKSEATKVKNCSGYTCKFMDTCGQAPLNPLSQLPKKGKTPYVVYGEEQVYGEWPQYVRLLLSSNVGHCGGVLITNQHVLTAAHCTYRLGAELEPKDLIARLADHFSASVDSYERNIRITSICRSYRYVRARKKLLRYDYSVLTLEHPVEFGDHIQPACLPYKPLNIGVSGRHMKCYLMGLGKMQHERTPTRVQKLRVKRTKCDKWGFGDDDRSRHCFIASTLRGDSCRGDSGGPVLCLTPERKWTVAGIVSYGSFHCDGTERVGWVAVYTRVRALLEYMQDDCGI